MPSKKDSAKKPIVVTPANLVDFLGPPKFLRDEETELPSAGMALGLAWTAVGGEILQIEVVATPGAGKLKLTGQLGEVMRESAEAALSHIRANASKFKIDQKFFGKNDIHIHVPAGAIPKDGPSAGITIATAIVSLATKKKIRQKLAMTGELTLTGRVLPIGGLREKAIAGARAGITDVVAPERNEKDLIDLPETVRKNLKFHFAKTFTDVW